MAGKTISEKILASHSGRDARAGDLVVCKADQILGTDASTPLAIRYFEAMGGTRVHNPDRVHFALDHYAPPSSREAARIHNGIRAFARRHGIPVLEVGEGIGLQLMVEKGCCLPGELVIAADSHAVMFGALNCFGTGVGSSDLAAAMICGKLWLRVPESIRVVLDGEVPPGIYPKDIVLALSGRLGADGANYHTLEFAGPGAKALELEDRLVVSNMAVEMGAKAGVFEADEKTASYLAGRTSAVLEPVTPDTDARYAREVILDVAALKPQLARPPAPSNVSGIESMVGTPVHMVFIGTCMGGRVRDIHQALEVLESNGGIAVGVQLVVTPASREVYVRLAGDGSLARLLAMGAIVTTPGCGACCGTAGVIPGDDANVMSTANRNFRARMGNPAASIYLASPASCAAAAATGRIVDTRAVNG
jgi:3-isopropylmalate/(R)-2-methylmalate dehydratase large subunit